MNWQAEHERLMDEMAKLAGVKRVTNLEETLKTITDPEIRRQLIELNRLNDIACEKAEKQQ